MKWREYLNDSIDEVINSLNKAKTAIAENDALGAGIWMGRTEMKVNEINFKAVDVTSDMLDELVCK